MEKYRFTIEIEAKNYAQALIILGARLGYDEDLSEDGVENYAIGEVRNDADDLILV